MNVNNLQLSDAIDQGLAVLGCNERPEGWREANFGDVIAYVSSECPEILGEVFEDLETIELVDQTSTPVFVARGVVSDLTRSWDFRAFGQSLAVRKHRVARSFLRVNEWKVKDGLLSRKAVKKAAKKYADRAVADDACAGCRCAVRSGSRTWLAVL